MGKYTFSVLSVAMLLASTVAYAQTTPVVSTTDTQTTIKLLREQIQTLETQIAQLKVQLESTSQQVAAIKTELKINRFLKRGVTGEDVKQLQLFLSKFPSLYPEGLVTGYYGPKTEAAVKKLQEVNGIEAIGMVGPKTLARINTLIAEVTEVPREASSFVASPEIQEPSFTPTMVATPPATTPTSATATTSATSAQATTSATTTGTLASPSAAGGGVASAPSITSVQTTTATSSASTSSSTDSSAPYVSNILTSNISSSEATISWTTNEPADSQVANYGADNSQSTTTLDTSLVTSHSVLLSSLKSGTTYYYFVYSKDSAGNRATGGNSFTTSASPSATLTAPATPSNFRSTVSGTTVTLDWTDNATNESGFSIRRVNPNGGSYSFGAYANTQSAIDGSLSPGTYTYTIQAYTSVGNSGSSSDWSAPISATVSEVTSSVDTTAPILTLQIVKQTQLVNGEWLVEFQASEEVTGVVYEYGVTTSYGSVINVQSGYSSGYSTANGAYLPTLSPGTLYHIRGKGTDHAGNIGYSSDYTFTTDASSSMAQKNLAAVSQAVSSLSAILRELSNLLKSL